MHKRDISSLCNMTNHTPSFLCFHAILSASIWLSKSMILDSYSSRWETSMDRSRRISSSFLSILSLYSARTLSSRTRTLAQSSPLALLAAMKPSTYALFSSGVFSLILKPPNVNMQVAPYNHYNTYIALLQYVYCVVSLQHSYNKRNTHARGVPSERTSPFVVFIQRCVASALGCMLCCIAIPLGMQHNTTQQRPQYNDTTQTNLHK